MDILVMLLLLTTNEFWLVDSRVNQGPTLVFDQFTDRSVRLQNIN